MKSTGIVRKVDPLGRVVLPIELRRTLQINEKDELQIYVEGDKVILQKHKPVCLLCGSSDKTKEYKGKLICSSCIEYIKG